MLVAQFNRDSIALASLPPDEGEVLRLEQAHNTEEERHDHLHGPAFVFQA
jgi:hypothetical protein